MIFIFATALFSSTPPQYPPSKAPIIGVLALPITDAGDCVTLHNDGKATSCFHSLYVKWLEAAGARVAPIPFDLPSDQLDALLGSLNGALFTGGGVDIDTKPTSQFMQSTKQIYQHALTMHANGEVWPLWGTCFGMQVLSMLGAGTHSVVVSHPAESLQLPLALTPAAAKSQLLCTNCLPADVLRTLTTRNATVNLHNFGVDVESFQSGALGKAFSVLSTNIDTRGRMFASTIEAKGGAPIFGTQWHPERPQFEWTPGMIFIERDAAIETAMFTLASKLVDFAKQSKRSFPSAAAEESALIYNYRPVGDNSYEAYFFAPASTVERLALSPTGELSAVSKPITVCGSLSSIDPGKAPVIVRVYTLPSGVALTKELILGDSTGQSSPTSYKQVLARVAPPLNASYCLSLPSGSDVYVFAFADVDRDWKLDAATEPLGWLRAEPSAPPLRVKVGTSNGNVQELPPIALHALTPFRSTSTANGKLEPSADGRYWHMKLHGSGPQRAQAHGFLAAKQIVDFFRFFILESVVKSASRYAKVVAPGFNSTFAQYSDPEYMAEANALLQGMSKRAAEAGSGKALLMVPELGRPFSYEDLFAINAYDAFDTWSACSQLIAWGSASADGGTVTARNMDGETDVRHATVAYAMLFAHAVEQDDKEKSFVSIMWPGHLGSFSMLAEDGVYGMMNAGSDRPDHKTPPLKSTNRWAGTWVLRKVIASGTTPSSDAASLKDAVDKYASSAGGACDPGCIFVWARPHDASSSDGEPAGMIYEGDRLGGSVRLEGVAPPYVANMTMATNHFLQTGVKASNVGGTPGAQTCCDGCECSFSSQFRYMAGMQYVAHLDRDGLKVDPTVAQEWLSRVAHATTEHSVVTLPAKRKFGVMVADSRQLWDAPYRKLDWVDMKQILREARAL